MGVWLVTDERDFSFLQWGGGELGPSSSEGWDLQCSVETWVVLLSS